MKFDKVAIFITLFSLWLTNYFSGEAQEFVAFFLIFSVGILHGSNDLAIMNKLQSVPGMRKLMVVLALYLFVVLLAGGFFYLLPKLALTGFILFSGYHFGEQQWQGTMEEVSPMIKKILYLFYGMLILTLLFYMNANDTQQIIASLSDYIVPESWYIVGLTISSVVVVSILIYMLVIRKLHAGRVLFEGFLLLVFAIVFKYASLIWAFAIYFIYWHSIPSIFGQLHYLYGEVSVNSFKKYLRSSSIIWVISVGTMLLVFYMFRNSKEFIMPLFFAFLGAITFAHSLIISKMFRQKKDG